ncbi:MAG: ribonuclease [Actinomycetota bacterium]|jgi:ribonuclease D|nr:ribonuclease [Actinomycetota bacterium]
MAGPSPWTWIDQQPDFDRLCAELATVDAIALDTEFHRERTYFPHVALVQLAWAGGLALVDPLKVSLEPLGAVIATGPAVVAHAAEQDFEVLDRACGAVPTRLFDTQIAAAFLGFSSASLATLLDSLLGVRLPKGDRLTNWNRRPLTDDQLAYAASDVEHLIELRDVIVARLDASGRRQWADEECDRFRLRWQRQSVPEEAWWRLKETRRLRGSSRGVAQEVASWREHQAMAQDLPARFVLPDMAIAAIAQRPPKSLGDLNHVRALEGRQPKPAMAKAIIEAVERGLALGESDLHLPPVDDLERAMRPAVALVAAWLGQLGKDLEIDATTLATKADVQDLLSGSGRLTQGWRAQLVGEPVKELIAGRAALAFDGDGRLVLETRSGLPLAEHDGR